MVSVASRTQELLQGLNGIVRVQEGRVEVDATHVEASDADRTVPPGADPNPPRDTR